METNRRTLLGLSLVAISVLAAAPILAAGREGAFAGDAACLECHEDVAGGFAATAHGRAEWVIGENRCEACHGPGQAHIDGGGDAEAIRSFRGSDRQAETAACLRCHDRSTASAWASGAHDEFDVTCASCHRVHTSWRNEAALRNQDVTETCLTCHKDRRKHLFQRSTHPLREGLMSCATCHDPHGSAAESAIAALTPNDKCYECHADKRGPYLFEHTPVREDCGNCHDPHGTNQEAMLKTAPPRLCQSCHLFGHHQTVPGQPTQVWNQNRSCVNCHPRIHGSNHPSGVIFMR